MTDDWCTVTVQLLLHTHPHNHLWLNGFCLWQLNSYTSYICNNFNCTFCQKFEHLFIYLTDYLCNSKCLHVKDWNLICHLHFYRHMIWELKIDNVKFWLCNRKGIRSNVTCPNYHMKLFIWMKWSNCGTEGWLCCWKLVWSPLPPYHLMLH